MDLIFGLNPVLEALRAGQRTISRIYITAGRRDKRLSEVLTLARLNHIEFRVLPGEAFNKRFHGKGLQGVVAEIASTEYVSLEEIVDIPQKEGKLPLFLLLDELEDPRNLGAILRTAEAGGVQGIIIPSHRAVDLGPTVAKTSAGAIEYVPVVKVSNLKRAMEVLREKGIWIYGADLNAPKNLWEEDLNVPLAIVFGSEGRGLRKTIRQSCDALISIPMFGRLNSLNVSVAAGVVIFEILRQRQGK